MKIFGRLILLLHIGSLMLVSCSNDDGITKLKDNGLTNDINKSVPDSVLTAIKNTGMTINTGDNPPILDSAYVASPFVLKESSRENDSLNSTFKPYEIRFYNQDNETLTLSVEYTHGNESGNTSEAYIVGKDNMFSIFFTIPSRAGIHVADITHVISGEYSASGIYDFHYANYMIDNKGNPGNLWINNGDVRLFYDTDSLSKVVQ